jgi:predicted glycosyltransferase
VRFWVDVDNAPHVLVMAPIIRRLESLGHTVEITARDYGQTISLLNLRGLPFVQVGRHSGRGMLGKYIAFVCRSFALYRHARRQAYDVAISHGTRAIYLPARLLSIPLITLGDYEHTALPAFMAKWVRLVLAPDVIPASAFAHQGFYEARVRGYPGLKEDLYVHEPIEEPALLGDMRIDRRKVIVLLRPPATMAHYYVQASGNLFDKVLAYLCSRPDVEVILLPRTDEQGLELAHHISANSCMNVRIPTRAYDGPSMVWHSDLVISGGGTMNREAATLHVPVYSIYQGPLGAVDRHLVETGCLKLLTAASELKDLPLMKRNKDRPLDGSRTQGRVLDFIVGQILSVAAEVSLPVASVSS